MPLPSLPLDVWQRISNHLSPAELSSLCMVSQALHQIATDPRHFRRHLPSIAVSKHPATVYRRHRAWSHPPNEFTSEVMTSCMAILCTVQDTLLLLDITNARIKAFPSGLCFDIETLWDGLGNPMTFGLVNDVFTKHIVVLPDGHVAFVSGVNPISIKVLNVKTGAVLKHSIPGSITIGIPLADGKHIFAAGNNAEYLAYCIDSKTLALVDWRLGTTVKSVKLCNVGKFVAYMLCECPILGEMSVVGWVIERKMKNDQYRKLVAGMGFDGSREWFLLTSWIAIEKVLVTVDRKTRMLLGSFGTAVGKMLGFIASRRLEDSKSKIYKGMFTPNISPELRDNGRVIAARCHRLGVCRSELISSKWSSKALSVELKDDGSLERASVPALKGRIPPIWFRKTFDGVIALMVEDFSGGIELVKIIKDGSTWKEVILKRWCITGLFDMCVLDDHCIIATSLDGKLHKLHFDQFCRGGRGAYACPLGDVRTVLDGEENSQARKKRRITDEAHQTS